MRNLEHTEHTNMNRKYICIQEYQVQCDCVDSYDYTIIINYIKNAVGTTLEANKGKICLGGNGIGF